MTDKSEQKMKQLQVRVQRPVYQTEELNEISGYQYSSTKPSFRPKCKGVRPKQCLYSTIPILRWLPAYQFKRYILGDVFSGITVATMHIPHGLAYALLANLPAIVGIYMGLFPVLVYMVLGTSRHVSLGTFAVVCIMTGKVVLQHSADENSTEEGGYTPLQVASTVTFTVAVAQVVMYALRLGVVTALLSEALVSAFTCAATFLVLIIQLKELLGLKLPKRLGLFRAVYTLVDVANLLSETNKATVTMSSIFILLIELNNRFVKPALSKRTNVPFPIELIAIVSGIAISNALRLSETYAIKVVGPVPTGLPTPGLPVFSLMPYVFLDSLVITVVSYSVTISLALVMAQKLGYEVDANQELLAMGCSNCVGSFFYCAPITASLSRTVIQQTVGGTTQVASLVSSTVLLVVLLWVGPVFKELPKCVLSSVIVVSLKPMALQFLKLGRFWKLSKWYALIWVLTFFTTIIVGIDYGLLTGVVVSLISVSAQGQLSYTSVLGAVPGTELYLDSKLHKAVQEQPGIKVCRYSGSINFASRTSFKSRLFKETGFDPVALHIKREETGTKDDLGTHCIVLDFAGLVYIDPAGVELLRNLVADYARVEAGLYLSGCTDPVFEMFKRCERVDGKPNGFMVFSTVHDAVLFCQAIANKTV